MKKLIFPIVCCFISMTVSAQLVKQQAETQKKQSELDWFNCSFDQDSVYGAEVNKAYDYLNANKKKAKKRPVVALIGTGMDVEHEDLKQAIWVNPKEKLNQKDDDKNGWIDDINGWNFIGGKDGQVMESLTREGEREFFRLKDKYADYIFDGKKYYKIINGKRQEVPAPENLEEYNYYRYKVMPESRIGGSYGGLHSLSSDDAKRNAMYQANAQRAKMQKTFADYTDYLNSLEMQGTIRDFEPIYLQRIVQLTNKSNQFNLTTITESVEIGIIGFNLSILISFSFKSVVS